MKCGFKWHAPLVMPDGGKPSYIRQVCILERGHEGNHRSITKVIKKNEEKRVDGRK